MNDENRKVEDAGNHIAATMSSATQESLATVKNALTLAMDRNREVTQKMARAMRDISIQFMNARLDRAGRAIERSRECRGISELLSLQHDWVMDVARDYADMTKRLADVLHELPNGISNGVADTEGASHMHDTGDHQAAA